MRVFEIITENGDQIPPGVSTINTSWFRSWFGDSKVVDDNDQPLLVYHGTSDPRFNNFQFKGGMGGALGYWFASTQYAASQFARPRFAGVKLGIKVCTLRITNPKEYAGYPAFVEAVGERRKGGSIEDGAKSLRRALIRKGHDGIVVRNSDTDLGKVRDDWVAFDPKQIMILGTQQGDINRS